MIILTAYVKEGETEKYRMVLSSKVSIINPEANTWPERANLLSLLLLSLGSRERGEKGERGEGKEERGRRGEGRGERRERGEERMHQTVREVRRRLSYLAGWTHSATLTHKETQWKT